MIYSKNEKYCIFGVQDFIFFQGTRSLYAFREFLKKNNARCTDNNNMVYTESEDIDKYRDPDLVCFSDILDSDLHYKSEYAWGYCYCRNPGVQDIKKLYSLVSNRVTAVEHSAKEIMTCVKPNDDKGGCTMANVNESFKTVLSMKMLKGIMKDGDADLGKLFLMQQMTNGQPLQVSDVIKSKLINEFSLDKDGDLPLEKVLLLQMLDSGSVDLSQLIMFKMMGSLFDEDSDKKKE